jgi:thermosome
MKKQDILQEDTQRTKGLDARESNIQAAIALAEILKTTLGPQGLDKMLIDSMGDSIVTNDGVKILKEMEIEHPGAKILVDVAKTQESQVGDGTTTAVLLAGELLKRSKELLNQNIHPNLIAKGYKETSLKTLKILNEIAQEVKTDNKKLIEDIAKTAMTGKIAELNMEKLSSILFEITKKLGEENSLSINKLKIQKIPGSLDDSELIQGIVLDKNPAHPNMVKSLTNPKILLVDFPLEIQELEADAKVNINSLQEYEQFIESEKKYLKNLVLKIKETGTNFIVCQKGIDDSVSYFLAKEGILATRRTRKSDLEKLSLALNTPIVSSYEDVTKENLGTCKEVSVKEIENEQYVFVEGTKNPKALTLLLKASTQHVRDELERAIEDALGDLNAIMKSKKIVAGGGAIECELVTQLRKEIKNLTGKEEYIAKAFVESLLVIPKTLCQNSGFDEIEIISKLLKEHELGKPNAGINGFNGIVKDTLKESIIEPINVKEQAILSATEASCMILRIDDIIAARKLDKVNEFKGDF